MVEDITLEQLERKMEEKDDFVLVDVLSEDSFEEGHIPGAINIPLDRIGAEAVEEFDRDQDIVVYCGSEECGASPKAAEKLEDLGFTNVSDFEAGLEGWKQGGHGLES